jgi:hypothetical protein
MYGTVPALNREISLYISNIQLKMLVNNLHMSQFVMYQLINTIVFRGQVDDIQM